MPTYVAIAIFIVTTVIAFYFLLREDEK